MVTLVFPKANENYYIEWDGIMYGPGPYNFADPLVGDSINIPLIDDGIVGTPGIYHENFVTHVKSEGNVLFHPGYYAATPCPSAGYPDAITVPWLANGQRTVDEGIWAEGTTRFKRLNSICWHRICVAKLPDQGYVTYRIAAFASAPHEVITCGRGTSKPLYKSGSYYRCAETWDTYSTSPKAVVSADLSKPCDYRTLMEVFAQASIGRKITKSSAQTNFYFGYIRNTTVPNPGKLSLEIANRCNSMIAIDVKDIEKDYGDLASSASQKVNTTNINMLAFLRDLKNPASMIPSLKNVLSVKTMANNYLTVKYGILPTISDLQNIVGAFKRMKPYLDKNGFSSYNAGHIAQVDRDNCHVKVEQHIKLAIADEDNEFEALLERLESFGTLPTFENIWDLVPYSFVIDWFFDVGNFLERVDTHLRLARYNIRYATMSRKLTVNTTGWLNPEKKYLFGAITRVHYRRWVTDHCPVPSLIPRNPLPDFNHWLESAALLVQRAKPKRR